jgi:hypothetical protein
MDVQLKAENFEEIRRELLHLIVPARLSTQVGSNKGTGCWTCDPFVSRLMQRKENVSYLTRQLTWKPWEGNAEMGGRFVLDRQLSEKADSFPAGYETVKDSFLRLQAKLARQPFTAQFINSRLEKEYRSG